MTRRDPAGGRPQPPAAPTRVGLFGLLGSGNSGNDVSMETMLGYLRDAHPEAVLDAMSGGSQRLQARYGLDAIPLYWYQRYEDRASGLAAPFLKVLGKGLDAARIVSWVRRHDVVFVPGAGALEATLPTRPWGFPYTLFVLSTSGKLFRTKVALVSVGANDIRQRATRSLSNWTARQAAYRSYRDSYSRDAMRRRGIDTSRDRVYPDLAFGVPTPPYDPGDPQAVGVGVMDYYGGNDDRRQAAAIHAAYVEKMTRFTQWLVDNGHRVLLFGGDTKFDVSVAEQIRTEVRRQRPDLGPDWIAIEPGSSYQELMQALSPVGTVVATRYHNVICALKLGKPTIALGYSEKFAPLMADMGLADFTESASSFEVAMLVERFTELEKRRGELQQTVAERNAAKAASLDDQFAVLSSLLFPGRAPSSAQAAHSPR
jgi:polysaccharide pyruvyl transferase WcaK-like protein